MWRVEDHTADVCLCVEAEDWPVLLAEAARAFGAWAGEGAWIEEAARDKQSVVVVGEDATDAWVRWWRALHRIWAVGGVLPVAADVAGDAHPGESRAVVLCVAATDLDVAACTDVKAVTWHRAEAVRTEAGGWLGRIVLDV